MMFFKNYDSFIITIIGVILVLIGILDYHMEPNINSGVFFLGYGFGWISLGLFLSNYKEMKEYG